MKHNSKKISIVCEEKELWVLISVIEIKNVASLLCFIGSFGNYCPINSNVEDKFLYC